MGNTADFDVLRQGQGLFDDVRDYLGRGAGKSADGRAGLIETDAKGEARELKRRAAQEAAGLREDRARERGANNARWGGSGLAMSGSKALIRDADRLRDRQDEEDALFEGEMAAKARLRTARDRADSLRGSGGVPPVRSILSLGSKIYGRG